MNYLILVNKTHHVDKLYVPDSLVKVTKHYDTNKKIFLEERTYKNILELINDFNKIFDVRLIIDSGYRDYLYQSNLFQKDLEIKGSIEEVNKTLALPGYSEHQTGLAVDVGFITGGLYDPYYEIEEYSQEFKWISDNAHKYGFILRYPLGKENITGYNYEPWHLRYVGSIANYLHDKNKTLEEYLNCDIFK